MAYLLQDLDLAVRHIRQGEARIKALEDGIERFSERGQDTDLAEATLGIFREVLDAMREHETYIRADLLRRDPRTVR